MSGFSSSILNPSGISIRGFNLLKSSMRLLGLALFIPCKIEKCNVLKSSLKA